MPGSIALGAVLLGAVSVCVGWGALFFQKFPLACKDCGYGDSRSAFDPTKQMLDDEDTDGTSVG